MVACYTPSSDGAFVYEVSLNYGQWINSYGPDKQRPLTIHFDLVVIRVMEVIRDTKHDDGTRVF
jgi:hypothetical protein